MKKFNSKNEQIFIDRQLPHNFLAERMILSCLLINSEAIEMVSKSLSFDAFYFRNHQEIYKAIILMYETQLAVDTITVTSFLQDNGSLEKIGGVKVIVDLISQIPNLIYLEEYIRLVNDKFIRRSLIKLGYETINSGYITNIPLESILNEFENKLFNLTGKTKTQKIISTAEILDNIFFELKEKSLNPTFSGLSSGFYELDSVIQGFQKSDLIILAGRPSIGKTALSLNIVLNIIKSSQLPVIFFSIEMSNEQMIYRLLSMETNIDQMRLKSGKLSQNDWIKLNKIIKLIAKFPLFIDDTANLSVQDIRSKIKTVLFEQNKIGLIVIDYLQLMQSPTSENRVQELSQITRSLKLLAREFNIPVIALSQLSRNVETRIDKKPILADLKESGSIEQDADLVLMLYKNIGQSSISYSNLIEVIIAKQRNGPVGSVKLLFDEKQTKFYNQQKE